MESREPKGAQFWHYNYGPYNELDTEYTGEEHQFTPLNGHEARYSLPSIITKDEAAEEEKEESLVQLEAEQMSMTSTRTGLLWRVTPDYGEKDQGVVYREEDTKNGGKFSGWSNPLAWTDDGADDQLVV